MNQTAIGFGALGKPDFAFQSISRDQYYDIHGEKREKPKNDSYHPRYSLIEK